MATLDVFNQDAFSMQTMLQAVEKIDYTPGLLGSIPDLFVPEPVRTEEVWIEEDAHGAVLIQTSPRGAPLEQKSGTRRKARAFKTVRLAKESRITASELLNIRAFGSESEMQQVQTEVARRQARIKQDFDLTWENMRLSTVMGETLDADGSTIYNWATEFVQTIPTEVDFDLDNADPASGALRKKCTAAVRSISAGLKGVGVPNRIMALCGDNFWDDLTAHPEVRETYLQWSAAADLRGGNAWSTFTYGGIDWVNYRGTDSDATDSVGVGTDKAKFFPTGAGIFRWVMAPGESFAHIGAPGQQVYSMIVTDDKRDMYADIEMYSYPLPVCTMPQALYRARRT